MKKQDTFTRFGFITLFLLLLLNIGVRDGFSALVDKDEAVAIADLWYAMELNSAHSKIDKAERAERFGKLRERQVFYLASKDNLLDSTSDDGEFLAYVVKYEPTGYVIVSGEDGIEPIVVFSVKSRFRWDQPRQNFLRYFLGKAMTERWEYSRTQQAKGVQAGIHRNWSYLRSRLAWIGSVEEAAYETAEESVYVLWDTALWDQDGFYNDTVTANCGGDVNIPTGCTATAMAIKMRFHEWPPTGNGSHSYTDDEGDVQFSHSVNFAAQSYDWNAMPTGNLTSANAGVADLMYHCGVAVGMNYEVGGSGALPRAQSMHAFFRYKGTEEITSGHEALVKESVIGWLPVILCSTTHTVVADGYRDSVSPYFHLNSGGTGSNGWYNFDAIPGSDPTIARSYPYSSPNNYFYVDGGWPYYENGKIQYPYNTLSEGKIWTYDGDELLIKAGKYVGSDNVPIDFDEAITIKSYAGTVIIGDKLSLKTSGFIKIHSGGSLKIN